MERLKFVAKALAIGTRTMAGRPLSLIVDLAGLLAIVGLAVGVQFFSLPNAVKVAIPLVAIGILFAEGSFRMWRDADLEYAVSQPEAKPGLTPIAAEPEPEPDLSSMSEYERMVYEDLEDEKHRNELEAQLLEREREAAANGISGPRLMDARNSIVEIGTLGMNSATPIPLGNLTDSTVKGDNWHLGGTSDPKP